MRRIATATKAPDLHGPGKDGFKNGNTGAGISPTSFSAEWCNSVQEEMMNVVEAAGLAPSASLTQLLQALRSAGVFSTAAFDDSTTRAATTEFVRKQGLRASSLVGYSSSATLGPADLGRSCWYDSPSPGTLTLPSVAASGQIISIYCLNSGICTVQAAGGQVIFARGSLGSAAVVLNQGDSLVLVSNSVNWVQQASTTVVVPAVRGQFASLKASATGASAVVAATADQLVVQSAGGGALLLSNVNVTASVAAAAGLNGVDTGATAANTWYAMWVVSNGTATGMVLSLSATAPVLPAGMSHMARIGWIRTDGSGSKFPLGFIQEDKRVQWRVAPGTNMTGSRIMASGAAGDVNALPYIAVSIAAFVSPTAYAIQGSLNAHAGNDGGAVVVPNNNYGLRTSTTNPPLVFSYGSPGLVGNICLFDFAIEVANVYWASRGASILICTGYTEK